jgi:PTS system mannose-specific IID component
MANVALRSLFLEASWNPGGQQNLGLAAAIDPALKAIYGAGERLREARLRSLGFFNTNPIVSGLAIGIAIKLEESAAAGEMEAGERDRGVAAMNQALAAVGDAFFWQSWLPLCSLVAVWAVLSRPEVWWTPLILPIIFCSLACPVRFAGLCLGYRRGQAVYDLLVRLKINMLIHNLKRAMALLAGVSTVVLAAARTDALAGKSLLTLWLIMAVVVAGVLGLRFLAAKARLLHYWYPLLLVVLAAIAVTALGRG